MSSSPELTAVVYDPPQPGLPHMAVLFDPDGDVVAMAPVASIDAGEEALASLITKLAAARESVHAF